jgi:hypothetical protein
MNDAQVRLIVSLFYTVWGHNAFKYTISKILLRPFAHIKLVKISCDMQTELYIN